ncbi:MAG: mitochondrial fission ELM1 family protein [Alphaproteobacteria bacterium]|nr:mitochondrial fission ELM1 family protein [Alphaproteobacteria bacterium]
MTTCWVLTDGTIGMVNQALGFAEAMGLRPVLKTFRARAPWRFLAPQLWLLPHRAATPESDPIGPPWPDVIVACGSKSIAPLLRIRRKAKGRTKVIYVQDPTLSPARFDLVVAPMHDRLSGPNVLVVRGAVNRVTPARLKDESAKFAGQFDRLPRPRVAVTIGGNSAAYHLTPAIIEKLASDLASLCRRDGAGLMVTTSRRTGAEAEALLRDKLAGLPAVLWDGTGDNPYFAFLGLADFVIVTGDSVNMVSEALVSGKPVLVAHLEGGTPKFRRFHEDLEREGLTRPFKGKLETWTYTPLDDTKRAAAEARRRLGIGPA